MAVWRADAHRIFVYREYDELDELEAGWAAHFHARVAPLYAQVAPLERALRLRAALEASSEGARDELESGLLYGMLLTPDARRARRMLELLLKVSPPAASRAAKRLALLVEGKCERMSMRSRTRTAALCAWLAELRIARAEIVLLALVRHVRAPRTLTDCWQAARHQAECSCAASLDSRLASDVAAIVEQSVPLLSAHHGLVAALFLALMGWQRALLYEDSARGTQPGVEAVALCARLAAVCSRLWTECEDACALGGRELLRAMQPPVFTPLAAAAAHERSPATLQLFALVRDALLELGTGGRGQLVHESRGWASGPSLVTAALSPPVACRLAFLCTTAFEPGSGARKLLRDWYSVDLDLGGAGELGIPDMVRFLCACVHPTNAMLCSADFMPRWAAIEWLLAHARTEATRSDAAHALFVDWLCYERRAHAGTRQTPQPTPNSQGIMNVEPAVLLLLHWATVSPWRACELLARLNAFSRAFLGTEGGTHALESVCAVWADCLAKGVVTTLEPLLELPRKLDAAPPLPHALPAAVQAEWRQGCLALLAEVAGAMRK